jgi:hypothetical protein
MVVPATFAAGLGKQNAALVPGTTTSDTQLPAPAFELTLP